MPLALNPTTDDTIITVESNNGIIGYGNLFSWFDVVSLIHTSKQQQVF